MNERSDHPDVIILLDYQEAICRPNGPLGRHGMGVHAETRGILERAARLLELVRSHGNPIIFVRVAFDPEYAGMTSASPRFQVIREQRLLQEADPATNICAEIAPMSGEQIITKGCVNPFIGTSLQQRLIQLRAGRLVIGGVATNHVVEATARHAADTGYRVVVLEDLCAAQSEELHRFSVDKILPNYAAIANSVEYATTVTQRAPI